MNASVKEQFNKVAQQYDQQRRQLIPCFDDFYGTAVHWINSAKKAPRILDLGAGTGLFSAFVLAKFPEAKLTLIDLSENMLEMAKKRFATEREVTYIAADYFEHAYTETYDIVISSLSIHHLSHQHKRGLFQKIHSLLEAGGAFVNADQVLGPSPFFVEQYKNDWERTIHASGLGPDAIAAAIERRKLDLNATEHDQLQWLREARFQHVDCVYKHHDFAVFYAQKSR